jgi:ribosomal protein S12 methylthiotransferase accessory factor
MRGSYDELSRRGRCVVDPLDFNCYSVAQLAERRDHDRMIRRESLTWCVAKQILPFARKTLVPAQLVFVDPSLSTEYPVRRESITTGAAVGDTASADPETAGILECLERDASIGAWLGVNVASRLWRPPGAVAPLWRYVNRYWLELIAFDITPDIGIPVALVFCVDRSGVGPAITAGARAAFDMESALAGAIKEALQPRRTMRFLTGLRNDTAATTVTEVRDVFSRFSFWSDSRRIHHLEHWVRTRPKARLRLPGCAAVVRGNLKALYKRLQRHNISMYTVDTTIPELKAAGLRCVKVLSPELHPLYLDEEAQALFSPHYGEIRVPAKLPPHPIT